MDLKKKELIKEILIGIGILGAVIIVGAMAPGVFGVLNKNGFTKRKFNRKFSDSIYYLKKRKMLIVGESKDGDLKIELSENGKKKMLIYNLDKLKIKPMRKWDGKWRFVMFDIPNKFKNRANALRDKLKELGLYQFQKSVWVYPYPLENEIDLITQIFEVKPFVKMGEMINLESEYKLKKKYKLKNSHT